MIAHDFERESGSDRRRAASERIPVQLADKGNVAHGIGKVVGSEVEIIDG